MSARWISALALATAVTGCAGAPWKQTPHDRLHQRVADPAAHPPPRRHEPSDWWDGLYNSTFRPLVRLLSPSRWIGEATGGRPALDVNAFGEVPDSSWFTNRAGVRAIAPEEIAAGPNTIAAPAPGSMRVLGGKIAGATPGLVVRDSAGNEFFLKFDPPAYPEMASGAEVIATKLLWAAGYNVPENYVHRFHVSQLELAPEAKTRNSYNEEIPLDRAGLDALLANINPFPDGTIRALFSRRIEGVPLGPFPFRGVRPDDPNDRIPHERRRTLRALWIFSAWVNNIDTRAANSLDVFLADPARPGLGTVRHYLLDFGDSLGARGTRAKALGEGYEYWTDWTEVGKRWTGAGLHYPYWLATERSPFRSVGLFESEVFEPERWRPIFANPAFDESTAEDDLWAASIVARIGPPLIEAAVRCAEYSEEGAAEWVTTTLIERRRKILQYAFARTPPLVAPRVDGGWKAALVDLEVEAGLVRPGAIEYRWRLSWNRTGGADRDLAEGTSRGPVLDVASAVAALRAEGASFDEDPFLTIEWRRARASVAAGDGHIESGGDPGDPVELHLRALADRVIAVGLTR